MSTSSGSGWPQKMSFCRLGGDSTVSTMFIETTILGLILGIGKFKILIYTGHVPDPIINPNHIGGQFEPCFALIIGKKITYILNRNFRHLS